MNTYPVFDYTSVWIETTVDGDNDLDFHADIFAKTNSYTLCASSLSMTVHGGIHGQQQQALKVD